MPWEAESHLSTVAEPATCEAFQASLPHVFLCPQEVPFLGGEHKYGRSPQSVTWETSGDFVGHNLIASKLTGKLSD